MSNSDKSMSKEVEQLDNSNNQNGSNKYNRIFISRKIKIFALISILFFVIFISITTIINVIVSSKIKDIATRYGCDVTWSSLRYNIISKKLYINSLSSYCKTYGDLQASHLSVYGLDYSSGIPLSLNAKISDATFKISPILLTLYPELMYSPYFNTYNGNLDMSFNVTDDKEALFVDAKLELLGLGDLSVKIKIESFLGLNNSNLFKNLEYGNINELLIEFEDLGMVSKLIDFFYDKNYYSNISPKNMILSGIERRIKIINLNPHQRDVYMQIYRFIENPGIVTLRLDSKDVYNFNKMFSYKITGLRTALYWFSCQPFVVTSY